MKTINLFQQKMMMLTQRISHYLIEKVQRCLDSYPYLTFLVSIVGLALFILFAVTTLTILIVFPLSVIFGWM